MLRLNATPAVFACLLVAGISSGVFRDLGVFVPALSGGNPFAKLPLDAVFPLAAALIVAAGFERGTRGAAVGAVRPIVRWFALWQLFGVLVFSLASLVASFPDWDLTSSRNALAYLALVQLIQFTPFRRHAALLPALALFLGTAFGRDGQGTLQPWAWPVMTAGVADTASWLLLTTITTLVSHRRPTRN